MLIVLEASKPKPVDIQTSFSRKLVAALREQTHIVDEAESLIGKVDRWIARLNLRNRSVTLALMIFLAISSIVFGLGSALQIDQVGRPGLSLSERIGRIYGARGAGDPALGQDPSPIPSNILATYGAGFGWPDRFNSIEVQRETANSKVLWPLSTLISMLVLAAWLIPRSKRVQRLSSAD